jgi:hypothetical protein
VEAARAMELLRVFDSQGREVLHQRCHNRKQRVLDVSSLSPGVYLVSVHTDNGERLTKRFLKQ